MQQQALAEMSQNITQKCFEKCVSRPGSQLDTKQQSCLAMCMDRYIDTMQAVSHRVMQRGQNVMDVHYFFSLTFLYSNKEKLLLAIA